MNNIRIIDNEVITERNGVVEKWSIKKISDKYITYKGKRWYLINESDEIDEYYDDDNNYEELDEDDDD